MSRENPLWGAPRIHGELLKLGIDIGETSVGKYMLRRREPLSQAWRTFLENHLKTLVSVDGRFQPQIGFAIGTDGYRMASPGCRVEILCVLLRSRT